MTLFPADIDFLNTAILSLLSIGTSIISAVTGMGGGVVLLSLMTFFMAYETIIPIHGVTQLASNLSRTYILRKNIKKEIFIPFAIGCPLGAFASTLLLKNIIDRDIPLFCIGVLILYSLFKPKKLPHLVIPHKAFSLLGFVAGFLSMLVGATGPLLAPFFLRPDLNKEQLVATKSSVQIVVHLLKLPAFVYLGFNYGEYWLVLSFLIVAAFVGTKYGVTLLGNMPEKTFRIIFRSALFIACLRIFYKVLQ